MVGGLAETVAARVGVGPDPEQALADRQRWQRWRVVVRALPERDRRCLALRAEGFRYREIARVLGVSLGSVAKSMSRAIARLAQAERG
jgi:RNA polymerase sigma-70 factor (ECF subfamily)